MRYPEKKQLPINEWINQDIMYEIKGYNQCIDDTKKLNEETGKREFIGQDENGTITWKDTYGAKPAKVLSVEEIEEIINGSALYYNAWKYNESDKDSKEYMNRIVKRLSKAIHSKLSIGKEKKVKWPEKMEYKIYIDKFSGIKMTDNNPCVNAYNEAIDACIKAWEESRG